MTMERRETTADKPSSVSVASRVVRRAAKYSVEVSSPPWALITSVTAAKIALKVNQKFKSIKWNESAVPTKDNRA